MTPRKWEVAFQFQGFYLILRQKGQIYKSLKVSKYVSLLAIGSLSFGNFEHIQNASLGGNRPYCRQFPETRNQCSSRKLREKAHNIGCQVLKFGISPNLRNHHRRPLFLQ
jgi:hypothetical protein